MAPVLFSPAAQKRKVNCRSFYLDFGLLEDYWVRRKYHHTLSTPILYAMREALIAIEEEGLEQRWARHERNHLAFARGLQAMGLELLPPAAERLWTLNAIKVPAGVDEAAVRQRLMKEFSIEIGAGLGPLAGKVWRVGLMGGSSNRALITLLLGALEHILQGAGHKSSPGGGVAAAMDVLDDVVPSL
jgi:alanine-glyoxylate transaminase/serine-glyoxylate transaminase/serine-pyruvate transaminase